MTRGGRLLCDLPGLLVGVFFIVAGSVSSVGWSVSNWLGGVDDDPNERVVDTDA